MKLDDHQRVKVLSLSAAARDHTSLQHILDHTSWRLFPARSIAGAVEAVRRNRIPVVVTSEQLADGDWRDLLSQLQRLSEPPQVIVMTATADDDLWCDFLGNGVYDVIAKPMAKAEVFRIIGLAWRQWHDQWIGRLPVRTTPALQVH